MRTATYVARLTDSNALEPLVWRIEILLEERPNGYTLIRYLDKPYRGRIALVESCRIQREESDELP